jgi:tRNA dimethylallyltransferase
MDRPLLAILGPTASGKTHLSGEIARDHGGEILSADARQLYVGMDIGTAKIAPRGSVPPSHDVPLVVQGIPHYLVDILTPDIPYSAAAFQDDALPIIHHIHARKHLPIVVGGTGHYVRTLTEGYLLSRVPPNLEFRAWAAQQPLETLVFELKRRAPGVAKRVDLRNPRRVIRALEILRGGGTIARRSRRAFDTLKLALAVAPEELRTRIAARVDTQLQAGLIKEVRGLVRQYGPHAPGLQAIAYQEVFPYLDGKATLEETRAAIVQSSWQYARRQRTWLRKEPRLVWVGSPDEAKEKVALWLTDGEKSKERKLK